MSIFDPPADPYGDGKFCRLCDEPLVCNWISTRCQEFYCNNPNCPDPPDKEELYDDEEIDE